MLVRIVLQGWGFHAEKVGEVTEKTDDLDCDSEMRLCGLDYLDKIQEFGPHACGPAQQPASMMAQQELAETCASVFVVQYFN